MNVYSLFVFLFLGVPATVFWTDAIKKAMAGGAKWKGWGRLATWLHLAAGGGVMPPQQFNALGRMPIKEPIITIEVGRGYRFVVMPHNSDPDTIILHGAIEATLLALWRENDDWYRLTELENSK